MDRERPYVIYSAAMSLDGKTALPQGGGNFSSPRDWEEVHRLRASVDAILVGSNTALLDNPELTVRLVEPPEEPPLRVVLDGRLRLLEKARVLNKRAPTLVVTTEEAPFEKRKQWQQKGISLWVYPSRPIPLSSVLKRLKKEKGVKRLLLEGGGTLAYHFFQKGLVDEVRVSIAPVLLGSLGGTSLLEGPTVSTLEKAAKLKLLEAKALGSSFILRYQVESALGGVKKQ